MNDPLDHMKDKGPSITGMSHTGIWVDEGQPNWDGKSHTEIEDNGEKSDAWGEFFVTSTPLNQLGIGNLRGILKDEDTQDQEEPSVYELAESIEYQLLKAIEHATRRGDAVSAVDFTEAYKRYMEARSYA